MANIQQAGSRQGPGENSPALQCRGNDFAQILSPVGTNEVIISIVPAGLIPIVLVHPGTEVPGYFHYVPDGTQLP